MFISHKSNVLQTVHETEWQCRRMTKGLSKSEYGPWLESVTSGDPPEPDYSGETGYTIVECTDEDVTARLRQLSDYISVDKVYNIKWSDSKVNNSHFVPDDTARDARVLAEKWANVRRDRDRRLAETDYLSLKDNTLSTNMKSYRQALRDVPEDNADVDNINWPDKP